MSNAKSPILIAMSSDARGQSLKPLVEDFGFPVEVLSDVEKLLFFTRGKVPTAIIFEDKLVNSVDKLELIPLLRRRTSLAKVPFLYLGPSDPIKHLTMLRAGIDAYISMPTRPDLLKAYLRRLLDKQQNDGVLRDTITRLREFEQAYRASERVKEDLTHMLVHDLKSPISSVMGLLDHSIDVLSAEAEAAGDPGGDPTGLKELLTLARGESQHLLNLAANILDVRRMKEGHMPYAPARIDKLSELARVSLGDVTASKSEREFSFIVRPEAEEIYADPGLMRRIIANLFSNAVKHTRRGGKIDFRAWQQGDEYHISIRDDGEGIPDMDQKRIFNAFEQSRHTIHDRFDTGMGLTFCKLAIEKHGGKIWVESKVGRGSTFYFTLPTRIEKEVASIDAALAN